MRVAAVFVYGLAASMLFAWVFQNHIIYNCGGPRLFERRRLPPSAYNLPTPQTLHNGTITAFERSGSDTFIYYYHGNGRRAHDDYWFLGQLYAVCNCSIYAIEYPQCLEPATLFGHSAQSLIAWQAQLLSAMLQPRKKHYLMGASLGTAFAILPYPYTWVDISSKISGVILENPFTSIAAVISPRYEAYIQKILFNPLWNNLDIMMYFRTITPVLFLTSERDEIVPPSMSTTLYNAWNDAAKKTHVVLSGSLHGHASSHPDYLPAVVRFLEST